MTAVPVGTLTFFVLWQTVGKSEEKWKRERDAIVSNPKAKIMHGCVRLNDGVIICAPVDAGSVPGP